jgi:hypothetical protein
VQIKPTLEIYRVAARQHLPAAAPADVVELTALTLAELQLGSASASPGQSFVSSRSAAAGLLSEPLATVLEDVQENVLLPNAQTIGNSAVRLLNLDSVPIANEAAGLVQSGPLGMKLGGLYNATEAATLQQALQALIEVASPEIVQHVLKDLEVTTVLGHMGAGAVGGLAEHGTVVLSRSLLSDPGKLKQTLFHEFGHLVDENCASPGLEYASDAADSPFGKGVDPAAYASPYAQANRHEDFAETHAYLMLHWNEIQKDEAGEISARGEFGQKLGWILQHAYRQPVPSPPPSLLSAVNDLNQWHLAEGNPGLGQQFQQDLGALLSRGGETLVAGVRQVIDKMPAGPERDLFNHRLDEAAALSP